MKKLILFLIVCITAFTESTKAQNTTPMWENYYFGAGDNSDRFYKIVPDGSGNFVSVGYTVRKGNYRDFLTVKFNRNGDTLWWATKNGKGSGDDEAIDVAVDSLGNVYVAGFADDGNLNNDVMLIKYDQSGVKLWDTTWNGAASLDDIPIALVLDPSGNIFVGGHTVPDTISNSSDYMTLKFDPTGALIWHAEYSRPAVTSGRDEESAMAVDSAGNVYVTGRSSNGSDDDFITIKYDGATGTPLWTLPYNSGNGTDRGTAITIDAAGNVIVVGRNDNGNNDDFRTIKYNASGVLQWTRAFNSVYNQNDRALAVTTDINNNVYVTGQSDQDNSPTTDYDFETVKYNASGVIQWSRARDGNVLQYDIPAAIVVDGSGNVYVSGKSDQNADPGIDDNDFMTVMYNSAGTELWTNFYHGMHLNGSDQAGDLLVDTSGIYVVGVSYNDSTEKDATVIKYDTIGTEIWVKKYNGEGDFSDVARSVVISTNDKAFSGGYSYVDGHNRDICLQAIDNAGNTICTFIYNGSKSDDDELTQLAIDGNGFVYAVGYTKTSNQKSDFFTMKWDPATCDTVWTRIYNYVNESDKGVSLAVDILGNVYMTGHSDSNPNDTIDNMDIVTIKYDSNGNLVWLQRYDGVANLNDVPVKLILDNTGNVIVVGITANIHDDDIITLKYDPSTGNPLWVNPPVVNLTSNDDRPFDVTVDSANEIFVCGYSEAGSGTGNNDAIIAKYDAAGNPVGFVGYDGTGTGNDEAVAITNDFQDNIVVAIKTDVDPNPVVSNYNFLTKKYNNSLVELWGTSPQYNSPVNGDDAPVAITTNAAGDIFVTGTSDNDTSGGRTNTNWLTVRYSSLGTQTMVANFDGPNATDDVSHALALRGSSLWVCGYTEKNIVYQRDLTTIKYDLSVSIDEPSAWQNSLFFPNPMNEWAHIQSAQPASGSVHLKITDVTGSIVMEKELASGSMIEFQRGNLIPGFYQYELDVNGKRSTYGKFIVE